MYLREMFLSVIKSLKVETECCAALEQGARQTLWSPNLSTV